MDWQADLQAIQSGSGRQKRPSPSVVGEAEPAPKRFAGSETRNFDTGDSSSLLHPMTRGSSGELKSVAPISSSLSLAGDSPEDESAKKEKTLSDEPASVAGSEPQTEQSLGTDASEGVEPGEAIDYDTCFGVLLVDANLSTADQRKTDGSLVSLLHDGGLFKVYFVDSGLFAGIIVCPGLSKLLREHCLKLTATLHKKAQPIKVSADGAEARKRKGRAKMATGSTSSKWKLDTVTARISIYGKSDDKRPIGDLLAASSLFLQHPTAGEVEPDIEYFNPHFLVRPGGEMPRIEDLAISDTSTRMDTNAAKLDEIAQARIWRIFDMAGEVPPLSSAIEKSSRLKSTCRLRPHQLAALGIMAEKERGTIEGTQVPTLWRPVLNKQKTSNLYSHSITGTREKNPSLLLGGVLADEMGLGKTLTTLALICQFLDEKDSSPQLHSPQSSTTLIVAPKSALVAWQTQIRTHLDPDKITHVTYYGPSRQLLAPRLLDSDIVLTTYDVLRDDFGSSGKCTIFSHLWHRVVLDEAHKIRNRTSKVHQSAVAISKRAKCRWCLTGTPVNNSLDDYGALLSFLQVPGLSEKRSFDLWIANPLKNVNSYKKGTGHDRLRDLARATCIRRTIASLTSCGSVRLAQPVERIEYVELGGEEERVYSFFKKKATEIAAGLDTGKRKSNAGGVKMKGDDNILSLINFLRLICNAGERMLPNKARDAWRNRDLASIDWEMMQRSQHQCSRCGRIAARSNNSTGALPCGHRLCDRCNRRIEDEVEDDGESLDGTLPCLACQQSGQVGTEGFQISNGAQRGQRSQKMQALIRNIISDRERSDQGDGHPGPQKSIIFSAWTKMLDVIQQDLDVEGIRTLRIDGQSSLPMRMQVVEQFKIEDHYTVMLASIGAAGEGIDLISACNVHIVEPQWNPMTESQAIGRVNRIGQRRSVLVTRYIVHPSIETYVRSMQQDKLRLIACVSSETSQAEVDQERLQKLKENLLASWPKPCI